MDTKKQIPEKYFPQGAFEIVSQILAPYDVDIKLVKTRNTKYGDFNPISKKTKKPTITINNNLNPYSFLIIFMHEFAHFLVWEDRHLYAKPHGRSWKNHFKKLIEIFINKRVFPENLLFILNKHLQQPRASSCTDIELYKELSTFDQIQQGIYVENLPDGSEFQTVKKQVYRKEKQLRKRILCTSLKNNKKYLFSPIYRVFPLENKQYIMIYYFCFYTFVK